MTSYTLTCKHFTWINIVSPNRADLQELSESYPEIHALHLEDLLSHVERPKLVQEDKYIFVVAHIPVWDRVHRISRPCEVEFILGQNYLVTVHDGRLKALVHLFARSELYEHERNKQFGKGPNHAFYMILDQLVDYLFPMLRKVEANVQAIEDTIFSADAREIIRNIALIRRDVIALRRIIRHQVPILEVLAKSEHPILRGELEEQFSDVLDHLYSARDIIDENHEVIGGLSETADSLLSHRINEVMRVLTVISVIMLPLTLISGIYGMNIELPLNQHPNAFLMVSSIMIAVVTLMLLYFRRRQWV